MIGPPQCNNAHAGALDVAAQTELRVTLEIVWRIVQRIQKRHRQPDRAAGPDDTGDFGHDQGWIGYVLEHFETDRSIENGVGERQHSGIGEYIRPGAVQIAPGRRIIQRDVVDACAQVLRDPAIAGPHVEQGSRSGLDSRGNAPAAEQPLRMQRRARENTDPITQRRHVRFRSGPAPSQAGRLPSIQALFRYVSAVICSEIRPIRNTITEAENSSTLMLVKRCIVTNVYT